ncbi:hypothetical protein EYR41_007154 [Orbilia oligospora]|uniref:Uncharacterized protein n=1 Tax=Orbilia oligospora TaxID=2813651 RepID=A0A8H2E252_ORBOL|nr:hypothetical protein TWF128_002137 [Orbilia oligospora]TGJ68079.1 hypothetical protein EYR41_007154 [Orbilia oligospora]
MSAAFRGTFLAVRRPLRLASISNPNYSISRRCGPILAHTTQISTSIVRLQSNSAQPLDKVSSMDWTSNSATSVESPVPTIPPSYHSKLPPRLGSTAGRSIAVRGGDVAGAFMQLRRICAENSIIRDANAQRFYERPGVKKKRLRRERFRRRFKESFKRMVSTVLEMKRQETKKNRH